MFFGTDEYLGCANNKIRRHVFMVTSVNKGDFCEQALYELLVSRFGRNCVYRSPKVYPHGQEKELADILVLALPYAIAIQSKWKKLTREDLLGEKKEVYRNRLIKTMEAAASQFKELATSINHEMIVKLPFPWVGGAEGCFELPLRYIENIIPVVIVDFEDLEYCNPELRYNDIPPVVVKVPSQIERWGIVHSFLLKDFTEIIRMMFTAGDFLSWATERERLFDKKPRALLGYNELSLFAIYLTHYDRWEDIMKYDMIYLLENDFFEHYAKVYAKEYEERESAYGNDTLLDAAEGVILQSIIEADESLRQDMMLGYLEAWGRISCCPAMIRKVISDKLSVHFKFMREGTPTNTMKSSYILADGKFSLQNTAYCFGVANYSTEAGSKECVQNALYRMVSHFKNDGYGDRVKEAVVLMLCVNYPSACYAVLKNVCINDSSLMTKEELQIDCFSLSKENRHISEWDMIGKSTLSGELFSKNFR